MFEAETITLAVSRDGKRHLCGSNIEGFSFSLKHGITAFINGVRYAMSAVELVATVKATLEEQVAR